MLCATKYEHKPVDANKNTSQTSFVMRLSDLTMFGMPWLVELAKTSLTALYIRKSRLLLFGVLGFLSWVFSSTFGCWFVGSGFT
jgi:hypothetical protein